MKRVALFTRAWIEMQIVIIDYNTIIESPSSRGRGLKYRLLRHPQIQSQVALFTRAWIEIVYKRRVKLH